MPPLTDAASGKTVAIVGATGAVGVEMLACLERSRFPTKEVKLFASERSAGRRMRFRDRDIVLQVLDERSFEGIDVALFASESDVSRDYGPIAVRSGAVVIDNSSAFRMDPTVPLVVPEVNGDLIETARIIANPNCVAAIMAVALWPLHQEAGLERLIVSTYQAASGAGAAAMEELELSTRAYLNGETYAPKVLPHPYAFNLFSHNTAIGPDGYNGEESKVIAEMRKILGSPSLRIGVTCIRVPVLRAHAMAVTAEFRRTIDADEARSILARAPGVRVVDDRDGNHFPMPVECSGRDEILVGRLRADLSDPTGRSLALFISGDQLLKGAALNAVQIAEKLRFN
jgi:aspartate-semialdehyde dehydrogenase